MRLSIGVAALVALVATGCLGRDPLLQSGTYSCTAPADCQLGWQCLPLPGEPATKVCFAPDDPNRPDGGAAPQDDGGAPPSCSHLCDCAQGWACNEAGACEDTTQVVGTVFCCEKAGCPSGAPCRYRDGTAGTCGDSDDPCVQAGGFRVPQGSSYTCRGDSYWDDQYPGMCCLASCSHLCDCPQGWICAAGGRCADGTGLVGTPFCCENPGCTQGASCLYRDGSAGTCTSTCPDPGSGNQPTLLVQQSGPHAIAVDATHIYWATRDSHCRLMMAAKDGTGVQELVVCSGPNDAITGIAADDTGVYYTAWEMVQPNTWEGRIKRLPPGGTGSPTTLAWNESDPSGISLDAQAVYWFTSADFGSVRTVDKDGTSLRTVISAGQSDWYGGPLAIDDTSVYFGRHDVSPEVMTVAKDGTGVKMLAVSQGGRAGT